MRNYVAYHISLKMNMTSTIHPSTSDNLLTYSSTSFIPHNFGLHDHTSKITQPLNHLYFTKHLPMRDFTIRGPLWSSSIWYFLHKRIHETTLDINYDMKSIIQLPLVSTLTSMMQLPLESTLTSMTTTSTLT
jgi:hypothetical protein